MKKIFCGLLLILGYAVVFAQRDSIYIQAKITENSREIEINQEIIFVNTASRPLEKIKLLNWIAAYKNRKTPLLKRKLEDRKSDLFFAKPDELGSVKNLTIILNDSEIANINEDDENIFLPLKEKLNPGEKANIKLRYLLQLPSSEFTSYGTNGKKFHLKYFFIVPDGLEDENQSPKFYIDIEENQSPGNHWKVNLDIPANYHSESNLTQTYPNYFEGKLNTDPEFFITENPVEMISTQIDGEKTDFCFTYPLTETEKQNLEFYLPLQLHFIKDKTGILPRKIFITEKFRKNENFTGTDDIKFWKFKWQLFTDAEKIDLNYFSIISKKAVSEAVIFDKNNDHWLMNGLKTYLEIQYVKRYYKDEKLLGKLPENMKILGMKPLKIFYAADLDLSSRYTHTYQYIMTENLDQKITEPFYRLSNFNASAISHFETGLLFSFTAEKMGTEKFDDYLIKTLSENRGNHIDSKAFLDGLSLATNHSSNYLEKFMQKKNRVNFNLHNYEKNDGYFQVKISKNTPIQIPFKIETRQKDGTVNEFWFDTDTSEKPVIYNIPQQNAEKIAVNSNDIFPEKNYRDNYLYTKGIFANAKKLKLKLFNDIPNPEYNEVYLNPRVNFNAYDKLLAGINFSNISLFDRKFNYSLTPYYSTGTGKITGSGSVSYTFQPAESFYQNLTLGISGSYFHYDYDLSYQKFSAFAGINFTKNPRSDIGRSLAVSYNYFNKDLTPKMIAENEYSRYNLWSIGYGYSDRRLIHEKYISGNLLMMEDFQRISGEAFYRWEYAKDRKISFRFFGGYFFSNKTRNNLFDYGISRISNFAFSYGLLGQSATSGILSQQYVLAEGGFKSYLGTTANQWIGSVNADAHVWRWFNVYADAGVYKNKFNDPQFIWDSGVKVKVIPDFLEVYFPVQSSLGFEPSFKDYGSRIRFTLIMNFSSITNYFRRGWF